MQHWRVVVTAGFAMFSMFFGSGNLVWPLYLGNITGDGYQVALLGLLVTAVVVPFLGLLAMILYEGDRAKFFGALGQKPAFVLTLIILSLMGPFGVVPRCIAVAYGSVKVNFPLLPLFCYSLLFCSVTGLLVWRKNKVVEVIGIFLTPWKLGGIVLLISAGLFYGTTPKPSPNSGAANFVHGFTEGYQLMDLLAAFFFSATIFHYLAGQLGSKGSRKELISLSLTASLMGALLLTIIYAGFAAMGAQYSGQFSQVEAEGLLTLIAHHSLGRAAAVVVSLTLTVACLATAVILTELFVDFIENDLSKGSLTRPQAITITLIITLIVSLLGFSTISQVLGKILTFAYPALIVFTLASILDQLKGWRTAGSLFWGTLVLLGLYTAKGLLS